uniref:Reverse transcriptase domain-containing protein n=1 Tax=Oryzias latipes TaxID=8090 RepID=A0A3P9LKD5_ORYLA
MGNVRSLPNKMDELTALTRHQREFRQASIMVFTETWLTALTPDSVVTVDGFQLMRADRTKESGKRKGGGLAVFVNNRWCKSTHITVKEQICSKDIELLAVSMRPFYLPREFSHVIVIATYIPPSANGDDACDVLHSVVNRLLTQSPNALLLISGDFNHAPPSTLLTLTQYVSCPTRDNRTLDLLYANSKEAYTSTALPPLGRSDHNLVHLLPVYKPCVCRQPAVYRTVRTWTDETDEALKDCFDTTVWEELCSPHGEDIDCLTECITDYINFCVENTVPTRKVRCFSNNKPWITPEIKALLKGKKRAFKSGNKEELRAVQKELRRNIRQGKMSYKRKLEEKLQQNNVSGVWRGLRTITGYNEPSTQAEGDQTWVNDLNLFFNRLDQLPTPTLSFPPLLHSTTPTPIVLHPDTPDDSACSPPPSPTPTLPLTKAQVRWQLRKTKARKASGPDGISPRLLRTCADELCSVMLYMFSLSLKLGKVPQLWKTSCVVPVPKTSRPTDFKDYRPVALISHLMKTMERLVLTHLRPMVSQSMDPLQFAYQPGIGVEDAVIFLLDRALSHLDQTGSSVRVTFFDFSSAFNTIQPLLLRDKLVHMGVDQHLSAWMLDYLSNRLQYVRSRHCESDMIVCNTGKPQGTVLAPFLFTVYTADFMSSSASCHLQKFSDDSAVVGLITDDNDREYRELIQNFVDWCQRNYLQINAGKTKELVVDFRRHTHSTIAPVNMQGRDSERVDSYKYLGVHLINKLDWSHNTEALYKKGQSRLYLLRRLRSFGVQGSLLKTFYDSVVASAIFYGAVCCCSGISAADRKRLEKLVKKPAPFWGCLWTQYRRWERGGW